MKLKGFTLAEVLITLAIIGVVAALTIPSVIANTQQQEFKTGLKKAVSVLNSAITMNIAIDGESPRENADLLNYLQRHMSVISNNDGHVYYEFWACTPSSANSKKCNGATSAIENYTFYTTDGMRFEVPLGFTAAGIQAPYLYESDVQLCTGDVGFGSIYSECGGCGSFGLNPEEVDRYDNGEEGIDNHPPCLMTVDVNGDRKPFPQNVNCREASCMKENIQKYADPDGRRLTDLFTIMITDKDARPYGTAAQKAMYNTQK